MEKIDRPDEKFHIELQKNGGISLALIGSTRSGKSSALGHILKHYFKKHIGVLMTNSPQAEIYKQMDCVVQAPQYIPKVLKDMYAINRDTKNHYDFLAILDDVVTGVKFDKEILKLLSIYRNSNISGIICAQAATLMNSAGRTNVNFVLLFHLNSDEQTEKVVKWYLSSYFPPGMRMIEKIRYYRKATEDHHFFVVDNIRGRVFRTKINLDD
jgi:hypothetical protein